MPELSPEDATRLVAMLEAIVADRSLLVPLPASQRMALMMAAGRVSRPTRDESRKAAKAFRFVMRKENQAHDRTVRAATELRGSRLREVFEAPPALPTGAPTPEGAGELLHARACYVCKTEFRKLHFFYDAMCAPCAEKNYAKRFQTASLAGRVALITGARLKIGYQAALMMLRAGARVVVTTRFPRDAAVRYGREADFEAWKDRLEVHGLDLRHAPSVEVFARYLTETLPRLDILINNAAQTVRRPAGFYAHLVDFETRPLGDLPDSVKQTLHAHEACKAALGDAMFAQSPALPARATDAVVPAGEGGGGFVAWRGEGPGTGIRSSALLSQVPCAFDDASRDHEMFPAGRIDADLQQVDLRVMNSWRMTLSQVPSPEMLEVQLVNAVAPFILCSKLKELMLRDPTFEKHIVNVSAMEGQFARHTKTDKHPHTNMAKAALNMMTLTSAPDYAAGGIFMNAVDTGWVTDEDPAALSARKRDDLDFQPPLDIVDGAARVCDPFFSGLLTGEHVWGKFLKDYAPVAW
jgi:NAD(P)-dependent dehydrogenase (short-subunit alcohol dehydrogenase family)